MLINRRAILWIVLLATLTIFGYLTASTIDFTTSPMVTDDSQSDLTLFGLRQGVIASLVFLISVILLTRLRRWQWLTASLLLIIITPLSLGGFWFSTGTWGISDWDYYFSYHEAVRRMVLNYQTIPHWNPYICGGTSGLGDPEFPLFTPTFLTELLFGIPQGLRLALYITFATTAVGTLLLAKKIKLSLIGALLAAITVAFGSRLILKAVEGHASSLFAIMWMPWIFWAWLSAYQHSRLSTKLPFASANRLAKINPWAIACGGFLALVLLQGGIHLLSYIALALLIIICLTRKPYHALKTTIIAGLWAAGFSALKLIPVLQWISHYPDKAWASSSYTLPWLHQLLLGRYLHGPEDIFPAQVGSWHEYGAYIGPIVLALSLVGLIAYWRHRLVRLLALSAILVIILSSSGPLLKPIFDTIPFIPRSNISRVILLATLPIGLLAGYGLQAIQRLTNPRSLLVFLLLALAAADLMSLSYVLSEQAFVLPPAITTIQPPTPPIQHSAQLHKFRYRGTDYTRAYADILAGYGSLSYCTVLGPSPSVETATRRNQVEFATISDPAGTVTTINWSPNSFTVQALATKEAVVTVNTNSAPGWYVNNQPITAKTGRLRASVKPGTSILTFKYTAPGFNIGLLISLATLIAAISALIFRSRTHGNR